MMRLIVEITSGADRISAEALSDLLYRMSAAMRSEYFSVLEGPTHERAVLLSVNVIDTLTYSFLVGELVRAPHQRSGE